MKKLTPNEIRNVSRRLEKIFNQANCEEILQGKQWYPQANAIAKDIASKYDVSLSSASAVISALSPNNRWKQNIKDAYKVFQAVKDGLGPEDIKVCTFHSNKFKAFEIATKGRAIDIDSRKTFSFVANVGHLNESFVTVDIWHLRACFNKTMGSVGKLAYEQIEKITLRQAKKLGLKGFEYQAIIWCATQRMFNHDKDKLVIR
jgi:hypothetical protein